ncbi:MAG TPA: DNA-binding response regulator [Micromonosporaceae bacterium]|nr:DNA-binding response regulator [Micromonosporaceae bacterium]HCU51603.1 DNA-binding response regulator [Micromonosporaceae bacterium]
MLVVEDEDVLADAVAEWLRREAFAVDVAYDGDSAHERISVHSYDVVVLDRDLPGMSGDELCREITTNRPDTRVLMLTASAAVRERVAGLALGADDYLIKPFAMVEMAARVHALARRAVTRTPLSLERGGLVLDPARHEAFRDGRYLSLSLKEFALLAELLRAAGTVVSAEHLLEKVWDEHIDPFTNTVRVTVMKLRKKLGEPQIIETIAGVGYRIP